MQYNGKDLNIMSLNKEDGIAGGLTKSTQAKCEFKDNSSLNEYLFQYNAECIIQ